MDSVQAPEPLSTDDIEKDSQAARPIHIKNHILRFIYGGTLLTFSTEEVRQFWETCFFHHAPSNTKEDLFRYLWAGSGDTDFDILCDMLTHLETFICEKEKYPIEEITRWTTSINNGALLPARTVLSWIKPLLSLYFSGKDIRKLILAKHHYFHSLLSPGMIIDMVHFHTKNGISEAVLLGLKSFPPKSFQMPKRTYSAPLPSYNCELWLAAFLKHLPIALNQPPFEKVAMLADCQDPSKLSWLRTFEQRNSTIYVYKKPVGEIINLHTLFDMHNLNLKLYKIPDKKVILLHEDIISPDKKSILHKDCVYNSPVCLIKFEYQNQVNSDPDFLSPIIDGATTETQKTWPDLEKKHTRIIEQVTMKAKVVYHENHGSITINDKMLIKFIPAKILKKMLEIYTETGRTDFEHREFTYDRELNGERFNPNIVLRIQRLASKLKKTFPQITLKKTGRGKVKLILQCPIEFYCQ